MAKKIKKTAKKVVKKVLDKTQLDEKIVAEYKENKTLIDTILCYGGYVLAIGTGCSFGVTWKLWLPLLIGSAAWAYWQVCKCKACKVNSGTCCNG